MPSLWFPMATCSSASATHQALAPVRRFSPRPRSASSSVPRSLPSSPPPSPPPLPPLRPDLTVKGPELQPRQLRGVGELSFEIFREGALSVCSRSALLIPGNGGCRAPHGLLNFVSRVEEGGISLSGSARGTASPPQAIQHRTETCVPVFKHTRRPSLSPPTPPSHAPPSPTPATPPSRTQPV